MVFECLLRGKKEKRERLAYVGLSKTVTVPVTRISLPSGSKWFKYLFKNHVSLLGV